jgi:hypothetical protein
VDENPANAEMAEREVGVAREGFAEREEFWRRE